MKNIQQLLSELPIRSLFKESRIGIEKESQRVTLSGELATTDHPKEFGNRAFHPTIQTDFSETQVEMITPVANSEREVFEHLASLHDVVRRTLPENEMLWPLSMPPVLPENDDAIKIAKLASDKDVAYREHLAKTYGKRKQMVSGIHYNFEFDSVFLKQLHEKSDSTQTFKDFKTDVYLKVSRNYLRYRWFVTYMMGAAPLSEEGYFTGCPKGRPNMPVRSIRNSNFGYTNDESVFVSYKSMDDYATSIQKLVETGKISEEKEFYSAVRLRGGSSVAAIQEKGVGYIEIRNIDNNPFANYGITEEQIKLLHYFLMLMLWLDEAPIDSDEWLREGERLNNQVALENPLAPTSQIEEGERLLIAWLEMMESIESSDDDIGLVKELGRLLANPEETLAGKMLTEIKAQETQEKFAIELGNTYQASAWEKPYQLAGFRDMELSTQLLLFDCLQKGISAEILDRQDQFLKLSFDGKVEYVKKANMTSLDTYVVSLMMENKTVTKKVLDQAGFKVPAGKEFTTKEDAIASYAYFIDRGIVVKPKSTNYGLGISIFKEGASLEDYSEAIDIAFKEDTEVLVEEFLPGTEYRFFVIGDKTEAIMLRVPANVKGDGVSTIAQLVEVKNQDSLRGTKHRTPLQLIELGPIEKLMLKEQGLTVESVLEKDQVVYLRENSNVSTGGDSIDMTDEMPEYYKEVAAKAVQALGATISGIDLIIPDIDAEVTPDNPGYGIIEANFNPAMHMHAFPFAGKGRRLTLKVLERLFPNLTK